MIQRHFQKLVDSWEHTDWENLDDKERKMSFEEMLPLYVDESEYSLKQKGECMKLREFVSAQPTELERKGYILSCCSAMREIAYGRTSSDAEFSMLAILLCQSPNYMLAYYTELLREAGSCEDDAAFLTQCFAVTNLIYADALKFYCEYGKKRLAHYYKNCGEDIKLPERHVNAPCYSKLARLTFKCDERDEEGEYEETYEETYDDDEIIDDDEPGLSYEERVREAEDDDSDLLFDEWGIDEPTIRTVLFKSDKK